MSGLPLGSNIFDRYLHILKIAKKPPSLGALNELVATQLMRAPFENISKLYYLKRFSQRSLPSLEQYLDGIEYHNFGGTCYSNNYYFYLLLEHLGYKIKLCGADMATPDGHMVSMVAVDGHEHLVDVGYAAPFLNPLPRDLTLDHIIKLGHDRYVLKPQDHQGRSYLELYRDGNLRHSYVAKPTPRGLEHFAQVIADSFTDRATFMNSLLLVRFFPNRSIAIHNLTLIKSEGINVQVDRLTDRTDLPPLIEEHFGISRKITAEAMEGLGSLRDAWDDNDIPDQPA